MKPIKTFRAFTLIEILITIGILAILTALVLLSLGHMFDHGNRLRRISDMRLIQKAVAEYAADNGGQYPVSTGGGAYWNTQCGIASGYPGGHISADTVVPGIVPAYLSAIPADPDMHTDISANGIVGTCCYMYKSDGKDYKIIDSNCSTANYADPVFKSMGMIDPCRPGPYLPSFAIGLWSPGAANCTARPPANGW